MVAVIEQRVAQFSADEKRHLTLRAIAELDLTSQVEAVRAASISLASAADPLIAQKLAVLQPTEHLAAKLPQEGEVECPACGQAIPIREFRGHVSAELKRLTSIRETFNARNDSMANLCDLVNSLKTSLAKSDIKSWRDSLADGALAESLTYLHTVDCKGLRTACDETDLQQIELKLLPLVGAAASVSVHAPPSVQQLIDDKQMVEVAEKVIKAKDQDAEVNRAETLIALLRLLERKTREEIRLHSNSVITEISEDIKRMWSVLHPGESIDDIHLYLPDDVDKAIDIGLKFYGKEQDSPRLTLSEGYRNGLGLCIFLGMAKREAVHNRPVVLDDVVVSLDRNHRGMIVELLQREFSERQVIIFTHDRDWYTELRQQLDEASWTFKGLLPYESPDVGIRWSDRATTFDDARTHLNCRPDSAGNDARKIMDVELALISERLQIELPFLRFDKNDRRTAHEFLERIISVAAKCFQVRVGNGFATYDHGIEILKSADKLLVSWANRAAHSFDIVRPEATKLIDSCEKAIATFKCASCSKHVWFADAGGAEWVQCQCGGIRWRYGKG